MRIGTARPLYRSPTRALLGALFMAAATTVQGAGREAPDVPRFERIGTERGLPSDSVTALYQDRAGFVWIGSWAGLTLYDGYTFRTFDHDIANPASLAGNAIRTLYEDREGNLWIGTNTAGLERLDRATWTFEHHRHDSKDPQSISHDSVYAILEDRRGRLWVATQSGLNRMDRATGKFERFMADPAHPDALSHDYVYTLFEDRDGALWIGTVGGGLDRMDPDTGRFTHFRHDPSDPKSLDNDRVFAITEAPSGDLWLGTDRGVCKMDRARGTFERVPMASAAPGRDPFTVVALEFQPPGTLWVATWESGLHSLDFRSGASRAYPHLGQPEQGRWDDRLTSLLLDRDHVLWIGTWSAGIARTHPAAGAFSTITRGDGGHGLSHREAMAVLEDASGRLWVGTWGGGLDRRDVPGGPFASYRDSKDPRTEIVSVLSAATDRRGAIWVGTMAGLVRLDPATRARFAYVHDNGDRSSLGAGYVTAVLEDRQGRMWVGTGGGGLNLLRRDGSGFDHFVHDPSDAGSLSDDYVTALREDSAGALWVGTRSGGLNARDPATGGFTRFLPDPAADRSLSHHYVAFVLETRDRTLWIGTSGGGLDRLERDAAGRPSGFTRVSAREGLVDDNVVSAAEDDDGSLWVGTRRGLSRFDPRTRRFANFTMTEGLASTQFNPGGAWGGKDAIYFASAEGVLVVRKGTPFPDVPPSPTVVTSIRTLRGTLALKEPAWSVPWVEVPYGEILAVEFAVLDFTSRHRYGYRVVGRHDDWIDLGTRREVTFADLDPGTYTLEVRGRNGQGVWSSPAAPLAVRVVPPYWMTWWFRGAAAVLLVGAVLAAFRVRIVALERRTRELQALQVQRERALQEARSSQEALGLAYERLRALTRRLEAAKEEERAHIARELHDEMGQALTAAKINLQLLECASDPDERARRFDDTFDLMDSLIQRVRALSLDLRPPLLDELGFVTAIRGYLEAQARRAGIDIDVDAVPLPRTLPAEPAIAAFRGVQESVTNIIRHAGATRARVTVRHDVDALRVAVRDDGRGFDVAEAFERGIRGGNLGLLGIQERIEALGGSLEIESAPGAGTEVRMRIPLET